jgi:hypothetical protein
MASQSRRPQLKRQFRWALMRVKSSDSILSPQFPWRYCSCQQQVVGGGCTDTQFWVSLWQTHMLVQLWVPQFITVACQRQNDSLSRWWWWWWWWWQ